MSATDEEGEKRFLVKYNGRQHYHPQKYFGGRWKFILQHMLNTIQALATQERRVVWAKVDAKEDVLPEGDENHQEIVLKSP